jgi:hypothetical protein
VKVPVNRLRLFQSSETEHLIHWRIDSITIHRMNPHQSILACVSLALETLRSLFVMRIYRQSLVEYCRGMPKKWNSKLTNIVLDLEEVCTDDEGQGTL